MSDHRFAVIDPSAGISGDMLLGSLIAAGAPADWLRALPARLGCPDVTVDIDEVDRCAVRAVKVTVRLPDGSHEHAGEPHGNAHAHAHVHGGHAHRHIGELIRLVERAPLSSWVKERAVLAFQLLGNAEAKVHGVPADQVALHEVGAMDALVDIVGVIEGFEQLGLTTVHTRAVAVGDGWVKAAHGEMSVPAPATAILLEGIDLAPNGPVTGEATTPTGAVLLRALGATPPPARWRPVSASAWGAGTRNPPAYANALRLMVGESVPQPERAAHGRPEEIVVLATDIDDLSPEYLEPLREALSAAGAVDVQVWTTQAKKGRVSFRVEALAMAEQADAVTDAFFLHSTTAGIRRWTADRVVLERRIVTVPAEDGSVVRVKLVEAPDGVRVKPEYDDIKALASRSGRPAHILARELQVSAFRLAGDGAGGDIQNTES